LIPICGAGVREERNLSLPVRGAGQGGGSALVPEKGEREREQLLTLAQLRLCCLFRYRTARYLLVLVYLSTFVS